MKKVLFKKIGLSLFVAAATLLWTTCEVGLGESIDNDAPTLSITGPAQAAVCRDVVNLAGICADDKGVKTVNITLRNTSTGQTYNFTGDVEQPAKAVVNGPLNWNKLINQPDANGKYPLSDGSYVADVFVTDVNNRNSGVSSIAFDIDNTAPVFCVTSPASLDITDPKKYGRSVTISGEIADDHDIDRMNIRVFRTDATGTAPTEITDKLAKTEFRDFETAGGTTVYIAKYFETAPAANNADGSENPDYKLYQNYMAIYDVDPSNPDPSKLGKDIYVYIVPTLTDVAGNTSDRCYLASDMKKVIAGACGVETTIDSLQTAQLMKIFNGTYTLGELNADQQAKILSMMNGTYALQTGDKPFYSQYKDDDTSKRSPLAANVNSNNNPTYDFNGYENPTTSSSGWVGVNTGGTVTVTLKAGRDGWGILPSSLEVNLYECNSTGGDKSANPVFSSNGEKDPSGAPTVTIKDATNTETRNIGTSVTSQSYYVTLPSLRAGNYYILEAKGKDENDSPLVPAADWYGFKVATSITPPSFTANDSFYTNAGALSVGDGYKFRLNIKDESDKIQTNGIEVTAYRYEVHIPKKAYVKSYENVKPTGVLKTYSSQIQAGATANNYYIDIPINDFAFTTTVGKNYSIVLEVVGNYKDEQDHPAQSSAATFMFWVDAAAPELVISSPESTQVLITEKFSSYEEQGADPNKKHYITPKGTWSDIDGSNTHRLWYTENDAGTPTLEWTAASGTFVKGTNYYEKQVAGSSDATSCYALLDTDAFVEGQTSVAGYYTLALKASSNGTGGTWKEIKDVSQVAASTSWEQKIEVAQSEGKMFRVVGIDAVGNLTALVQRTGLKFDFAVPTIALASEPASNGYYNATDLAANNKIVFIATDSYKINADDVTVKATKDGAATTSGFSVGKTQDSDNKVTLTITLTLTAGKAEDGTWTFTAEAKDVAERPATSVSLERIVDTVAPTFEVFGDTAPAAIKGKKIAVGSGDDKTKWTYWDGSWYSSSGLVFNGNITEATSGLAKVAYTLTPTGATQNLTGEKTRSGETGNAVSFNITATGFEQSVRKTDGTLDCNTLYITATDKAGNVSGQEMLTINIDQSQPTFAAAYYTYAATPAPSDLSAAEGTLVSDGTKDMTVYGTVSSNLSGVANPALVWEIKTAADGTKDPAPEITYTTSDLSDAASYIAATATWGKLKSATNTSGLDPAQVKGWKAVIDPAKLYAGDVYVTASNVAQKTTKTQIFTIDSDTEAPTINLNTPDTSIKAYYSVAGGTPSETYLGKPDGSAIPSTASVNGTIKIAGNASDNRELASVKVYWSLDDTATIKTDRATNPDILIDDIGASIYNWSVAAHEFSKVDGGAFKIRTGVSDWNTYGGTAKPIYIKVEAEDKAKNNTVVVYEYSVDPDSDRPKITFTAPEDLSAMTSSNYILKKSASVLRGKVEDDDGLTKGDKKLRLWYKDLLAADGAADKDWKELELTSGAFEIYNDTTGSHEGQHELLFKVQDVEGNEFITSDGTEASPSWLRPKVYDAKGNVFGSNVTDKKNSVVYIQIDTQKPEITNRSYFVDDINPGKENKVENSSSDLGLLGGTRNKFTFYCYAKDASGLDEENISFVFNGNTYTNGGTTYKLTVTDSTNVALSGYSLITVKDIAIPDNLPSGSSYEGIIKVVDKAGLENSNTITVEVDNTPPELTIINPSQTSTQTVSGKVNAYGTVTGADSGTKLYYALSFEDDAHNSDTATTAPYAKSSTEAEPYTELLQSSNLMWYLYFDGGLTDETKKQTHADLFNQYLIKKAAKINGVTATADSGDTKGTVSDGSFKLAGSFSSGIPIYIWIKAVDQVGNKNIQHYKLLLDPQGAKPEVTFSYPAASGETMGGDFKVYGGAKAKDKDNPTIKAVFAQIVSEKHEYTKDGYTPPASGWGTLPSASAEFAIKAADWNYLQAAGYEVYKMEGYPTTKTAWKSSDTDADAPKYGIPTTVNGSSWSLKLNTKGELDPKAATGSESAQTNNAAIRICSYDGVNFSNFVERAFIIDSDTPQLKELQLEQFGAEGTSATATASREYGDEIYVSGKWFLTFNLNDGQAMGKIRIGIGPTATEAASNATTYLEWDDTSKTYTTTVDGVVAKLHTDGDYKRVDIKYPLNTDSGCGTKVVYVNYEDITGKGPALPKNYTIKYDNKAPVLAKVSDDKYTFDKDNKEVVQQNDGWYSFGSKVSEPEAADSGFERLAFYFTRGNYVYDPMIKKGETANRIQTTDLTPDSGLYWKSANVSSYAKNVITIGTSDDNIHIGGLVKFGGVIYRIDTLTDGVNVGITGGPESSSETTALFAIANVVDNTIQESPDGTRKTSVYGFGYGSPSNDDNDLMVESIENKNKDWTWNASIYSKNIADGPVQIHYVAFDKAGNWSEAGGTTGATDPAVCDPPVVTATVSNNMPRLANLYVGTDLDGNNAVDGTYNGATDEERVEWTARYSPTSLEWNQDTNSGTAVTEAVLGSASNACITAKGMTKVRPEILGGNGNIYLAYKITNGAGTTTYASANRTKAFISAAQTVDGPMASETVRKNTGDDDTNNITIQAGDFKWLGASGIPDCNATSPHKFEFTFYDQTEDATGAAPTGNAIFNGTNTAKATIYMAVSMTDGVEPTATREDLHWKGAGSGTYVDPNDGESKPKNSVAWNGKTPLGHIDLSGDLPSDFTATTPAADVTITGKGTYPAALMDRDSKVSGQIILRGTVSDNKLLRHIYLKIPKMETQFDAAGMTQAAASEPGAGYGYRAATYDAASKKWTVIGDKLAANGIKFSVDDGGIDADGHKANWEFVWDTSYITNVAATDVTVDVYASDQTLASAKNDSGAYLSIDGTTKYAAPQPAENLVGKTIAASTRNYPEQLKVDVVPYITGLETFLSGKGVDAARTAKGHWPVGLRKDATTNTSGYAAKAGTPETFKVKGFNFSQGNNELSGQSMAESGWFVIKPTVDVSGTPTVINVPSLNNINNNDAYSATDYDNAYNRQPNGKNNNLLTDDVYIDVWQLNGKVADVGNNELANTIMKINPASAAKGLIGFAFKYGDGYNTLAMPNGTKNSYVWWHRGRDEKNAISFAFDSSGNSYGTSCDSDSGYSPGEGGYYADFFAMFASVWGQCNPSGNPHRLAENESCARMEMTSQKGDTRFVAKKFQSPSIATAGSNVYLAYYDAVNDELRFRSSLKTVFSSSNKGNAGNFINRSGGNFDLPTYDEDRANCQIVAKSDSAVAKGGPDVCVAAISGTSEDTVVMVWHDGSKMWYSVNTTPNTDRKNTINSQTNAAGDGWSKPYDLFAKKGFADAGKFCKVAVDGNGHVHVAAYSNSGHVCYAYLANPAEPSGAQVYRVDSGAGQNLTLDVALNSAKTAAVPYIGYYSSGKGLPKFARLATAGAYGNGIDGGKYTGTWEIAFVPSQNDIIMDNMNVGVWKDANGVLANSTAGDSYYAGNEGKCYGNGKNNAVMGYTYYNSTASATAVCIETAQLTGSPAAEWGGN